MRDQSTALFIQYLSNFFNKNIRRMKEILLAGKPFDCSTIEFRYFRALSTEKRYLLRER